MSLINQALQKVRAQEALQQAAKGHMPSYVTAPRNARLGWMPMLTGSIALAGIVLGVCWLTRGQTNPLPAPVAAKPATSNLPADKTTAPLSPTPIAENPKAVEIPHQPIAAAIMPEEHPTTIDAKPVIAEVKQPSPIVSAKKPPAPIPAPMIAALPIAKPAIAPAPKTIVPDDTVVADTTLDEVQPAPAPTPAPAAKEPALVNAQTLEVPGSGTIRLMAVTRGPDGAAAVINNTIVGEGETVDAATVVHIEGKRVQLKVDEKTFTLKLP